jgi:cytochrome P450
MVCTFTANRDLPAGEGDPDRFDITAERGHRSKIGQRALTFGAGMHYCVGANLARVELEEALAYLAPRMPGLQLAGEPVYGGITGIYGLAELPLRFAA